MNGHCVKTLDDKEKSVILSWLLSQLRTGLMMSIIGRICMRRDVGGVSRVTSTSMRRISGISFYIFVLLNEVSGKEVSVLTG